MKIATWNVNSIRTRLMQVQAWLETNPVDVLCLQETKVTDPEFPRAPLESMGYQVYISGQKAYNGVALLSRAPIETISIGFAPIVGESETADLDDQKRVISGVTNGLCVVNLYVPNGAEVGSEKYQYKLRWLQLLRTYLKTLLQDHENVLVCGDFNIAPEDRDIHDPVGKESHIMASPAEREALNHSVLELGFRDAFRQFTAEPGHFTWWDYRTGGFQRNRGWRIDHHYLSADLSSQATSCIIDPTPRGWEKPSDHTPVIVALNE